MKDIRIFVASSKELVAERNALAYLALSKAEEFEQRGFRVRLAKWEYVDPRMTEARTEDRYLDEMYGCDAALVLFRNVAGMYTREELDKALAAEKSGTRRLKTHEILFAADGAPDSDAARLRVSLPEGAYGVWSGADELRARFLALVDRVAAMDGLVDAKEDGLRTVSAFLAADDELAADRDAFADMVLNLNDILAHRGVRVKLRFYDGARHREILEASEMALVLYHTNCNAFGPEQMRDAYDRTRRDENPRRLYVFFRDGDVSPDGEFAAFRDGFAENLGHFFCRFENADTLKLNFLLSLETVLGEGASFVKLDGRTVTADGLAVGEITKLPMVANNAGLSSILAELDSVGTQFLRQRERCNADPMNDMLHDELLNLSARKNELQAQVDRELSLSLGLARRMASISVAESNETIARARACMEKGLIKEAIDILDGSSSSMRRRRLLRRAEERVDEETQEIKELAAGNEVEFFRVNAVMSYTGMPFHERFRKAESVYKILAEEIESYSEQCSVAHKLEVDGMLADILYRFAKLYGEIGDSLKPVPLLEKACALYRSVEATERDRCRPALASALAELAACHRVTNDFPAANGEYAEALEMLRKQAEGNLGSSDVVLATILHGYGNLKSEVNELLGAEAMFREALVIWRRLARDNPDEFMTHVATSLNSLSSLHHDTNRFSDAEREYAEALEINRRLAAENPAKYNGDVAMSLNNCATLHHDMNLLTDAEREYAEALSIFRCLAAENPAKFEECVAATLNNLAFLHDNTNRLSDSEREYFEALETYRRLAANNPAKYNDDVAMSLTNLANFHKNANRLSDAEREYAEALSIRRPLATEKPAKFEPSLARTLSNMGDLFEELGRPIDAERHYKESLSIWRRLAAANPSKFEEYVAAALNNMAILHQNMNQFADAEAEYHEAMVVFRQLAAENPEKFEPILAIILSNVGDFLKDMGDVVRAEGQYGESLSILRRLSAADPDIYAASISSALTGIAVLHARQGAYGKAEMEFAEALEICERLAEENPDGFNENLAETLHQYGVMLVKKGNSAHAAESLRRALEIRKALAKVNPTKFSTDLAKTEAALKEL